MAASAEASFKIELHFVTSVQNQYASPQSSSEKTCSLFIHCPSYHAEEATSVGSPAKAKQKCEFEELIWRYWQRGPHPQTAAVLSSRLLCLISQLLALVTSPYRGLVWPDRMCLLQNIYGFNEGETWRVPLAGRVLMLICRSRSFFISKILHILFFFYLQNLQVIGVERSPNPVWFYTPL